MTTGAFNDPSGDGNPLGQRLVVLKIRRVVQEIVGTVVHRLPLCRGHLPERGTAPHARRDQTGLPAQNFQQAPSRPAIWFDLLVGEKGPRRLPHILRHMDKVDDEGQWDVPLLRHLLEMSNLWKIAIHQGDPALLSLPIPARRLVEHLPDHPPATAPGWPRPVCVRAVAARTPFPAAWENRSGFLLACAAAISLAW